MASTLSPLRKHGPPKDDFTPRKKLKTSDLPLSHAKRAAIEELVLTIKKKGDFDSLRKIVWTSYDRSDAKAAFTKSLTDLAESEIDRDPSLLSRERGKAANLIEGALDRSDIYRTVEAEIDMLLAQNLAHVETAIRAARCNQIGEEGPTEEERRGQKTDADYDKDAIERRAERQRKREAELARQQERDEQEAEKRREERARQRAQERQAEKEQEDKRRVAREEADRERHERREKERVKERERRTEREKHRERKRDMERDEERDRDRERDGKRRSRASSSHRTPLAIDEPLRAKKPLPPIDDKQLEDEALNLLLREGQELVKKSMRPKVDLGRTPSVEPLPTKARQPSRITAPRPRDVSTQKPSDYDYRKRDDSARSRRGTYRSRDRRSRSRSRERDSRRGTNRSPHHNRGRTRSPPRRRDIDRDRERERERDRDRDRDRYREKERERPRRRSRSRSRSRSRRPKDDALLVARAPIPPGLKDEAKEAWKMQAVAAREKEAAAYKAAQKAMQLKAATSHNPEAHEETVKAGSARPNDRGERRRSPSRSRPRRHREDSRRRSRSPAWRPSSRKRRSRSPRSRSPSPRRKRRSRSRRERRDD